MFPVFPVISLATAKIDDIGSHTREAREKVCKYENTTTMGVRE